MPRHYDIVTRRGDDPRWFPASELTVGQLAEIHPDSKYSPGQTVLRCYSSIVSLTDPDIDWLKTDDLKFLVRLTKHPEQVVLSPLPDGEEE